MAVTTYDSRCYDLAENFLQNEPLSSDPAEYKVACHTLALAIQQAIEDWFDDVQTANAPEGST